MSIGADLVAILGPLVAGRVYPDTAPDDHEFPLIIYQQAGGRAGWYMEQKLPDHMHARIQVITASKTRAEANRIGIAIENAICESGLIAEPYGAFVGTYNADLKLYGTRQDFGIWYPR